MHRVIKELNLEDRIALLEIQNLPMDEFLFYGVFTHLVGPLNKKNNHRGSKSVTVPLREFLDYYRFTERELQNFIYKTDLALERNIEFDIDDNFSSFSILSSILMTNNELSINGHIPDYDITYLLRLSCTYNDQENFKRRVYRRGGKTKVKYYRNKESKS
jgi:hypothetical protein